MSTPRTEAERFQALTALAEVLGSFSDQGLRTLARAAEDGRLVRGQWRGSGGQFRMGCPLSCADGVVGGATAYRFTGRAFARNRFIAAWDRGLLSPADVAGLALAELALPDHARLAEEAPAQSLGVVVVEHRHARIALDVRQVLPARAFPVGEVVLVEDHHAALEADIRRPVRRGGRQHTGELVTK